MFEAYEEWDFNALLEEYKNSVFITLDTEHLKNNFPAPTTEDASHEPVAHHLTRDSSPGKKQDALSECSLSEMPDIEESPSSPENTTEIQNGQTEPVKTDQPSHSVRLRKTLNEQLNAVKDVMFLVDNDNIHILREAIMGIKAVYDMLLKSCPKNHGLPLRNSPVKKKLKPNRVDYHQVFHKKLPKRRKWKRTSTPEVVTDKLEGGRNVKREVI